MAEDHSREARKWPLTEDDKWCEISEVVLEWSASLGYDANVEISLKGPERAQGQPWGSRERQFMHDQQQANSTHRSRVR